LPKLLFLASDRLLRSIFGYDGVHYKRPTAGEPHSLHGCTFGQLQVSWRPAFTHEGKHKVRYLVNLLARVSTLPYEKDEALLARFRRMSLVNCSAKSLEGLDASQLVGLVNACMECLRKPYCSRTSLVKFLEDSSWRMNEPEITPPPNPASLQLPTEEGAPTEPTPATEVVTEATTAHLPLFQAGHARLQSPTTGTACYSTFATCSATGRGELRYSGGVTLSLGSLEMCSRK